VKDTYYAWAKLKGLSRRDFIKFCTGMTVALGLDLSLVPQVVQALETKPRLPVIYLNLQECTCCSESFIRTSHPLASDLILNLISLDYMEVLQAAAGRQAEEARRKSQVDNMGRYLVVVEGSIPVGDGGIYATIGGASAESMLQEVAKDSLAVIAFGSCATNTCINGAYPNPTQAKRVKEVIKDKPVIDVPGCPPIAEVISGVIAHYLTFETLPELNRMGRPKAFYNHRIHDNCSRRAYFDAGMFVKEFDDEGAKQGWCLYKVGCKGPVTYNACPITQWNDGTSWPVKSGHPCLGCSEDNWYDDHTPFYSHLANIPNGAIGINADKWGLTAVGLTAAGVALHGTATGVIKHKEKQHNGKEDLK
jgi:hydrogenase small subunit